ncbi:LD-carboxypeptidase [Schaalia meyeri]|uniref:LD-carboxypeptidase n=1 Tax=Schaalia meyeri TaxID=52773 RepID=A0AAP9Y7C9_9ACTO|nr:S66 peptidase family protein [Schaalia meyeri]QQC43446.1 LD-carboxypeptidase [Schaalia meyeri]
MIKTIGIVSLSSGILGESFIRFESDRGVRRLKEYGLDVKFMPHALMGVDYVKAHPEKRAEDLLQAFRDPEIDMILCAIGGDDTYRLLPYLFDHDELADAVADKVFLGFSDTTINHLMLHKVGLSTFYGQAFLPDICELGPEMLPYTRKHFEELISTGTIREVTPSDTWYEERTSFGPDQVGMPLTALPDHGFELLQGPPAFSGRVLGGCIDSLYDLFNAEATPTCLPCARSTSCSRMKRTGRAASSFWSPAKRNPRQKSTGRLSNTSRNEACSRRFLAFWSESPWTGPTPRSTGRRWPRSSTGPICRLFST